MPISYSSSENALMSRKEFATDDSRVLDFAEAGFRSIVRSAPGLQEALARASRIATT